MELLLTLDGRTRAVEIQPAGQDRYRIRLDEGEPFMVSAQQIAGSELALRLRGQRRVVSAVAARDQVAVQISGRGLVGTALDARSAALRLGSAAGAGEISTQMPGVVVRLLCGQGDQVSQGQPVIVVEAMKMENELKAPIQGVVSAIHVEPGQAVDSGALLITIEPDA